MPTAYLGLGANQGDRAKNILRALRELDALPGIIVVRASSLYETAPVGITEQPDFLNGAAQLETTLAPNALLQAFLQVEQTMGRTRAVRWGPRLIDLDLLAYGNERLALPALTVPHPRLWERAFALVPLAEIAPDLALPGQSQSVKRLAETLLRTGNNPPPKVVLDATRVWRASFSPSC